MNKEHLNPYIICAAIWYDDGIKRMHLPRNITSGLVAGGWRHGNCISILEAHYPNREYKSPNTIQGFLTSEGNFVDRKNAGEIAFKAGQTSKKINFLFSEDIY